MDDQRAAPQMSLMLLAFVGIAVALGMAAGAFDAEPSGPPLGAGGFDLDFISSAVAAPARPFPSHSAPASAIPVDVRSSLAFVSHGTLRLAAPSAGVVAAAAAPGGPTLDAAARNGGARLSTFTARFRERHPVMREYSRMWLRYPDLKKLNDDYMRDRDLARFVDGLLKAPSFEPLVRQIARDPAAHALALEFVTGAMDQVPSDLLAAATETINENKTLQALAGRVGSALGVPATALAWSAQ